MHELSPLHENGSEGSPEHGTASSGAPSSPVSHQSLSVKEVDETHEYEQEGDETPEDEQEGSEADTAQLTDQEEDETQEGSEADAPQLTDQEEDDMVLSQARKVFLCKRPIGLRLRGAREDEDGELLGGIIDAVDIRSGVLGEVGAGEEIVGIQRLARSSDEELSAEAFEDTGGARWALDGQPLSLRFVRFEDIMEVLKELSSGLKAGEPCVLLVD
jgi:hypothetical protein